MYICAAEVNAVKHSTTTPPKRAEPFCNKNGVSPDKITDSIRVLGYSFAGAKARKADAHESQQLHQATMKAEKCKCFPGGLARRIRIAAAVVAPKMIAGWLFRFPSLENVKPLNAATRTLLRMAQQSDPSLFRIRQGRRHFHSKEAMPRMLRESWQVVLYNKWRDSARRDAHSDTRRRPARWALYSGHHIAALTGAAVSPLVIAEWRKESLKVSLSTLWPLCRPRTLVAHHVAMQTR